MGESIKKNCKFIVEDELTQVHHGREGGVPGNVAEREVGEEGLTEQGVGRGFGVVSSMSRPSPVR